MITVFSLPYLPNIEWMSRYMHSHTPLIDVHEHYVKQSYRNRSVILSANGRLDLSIPVKKTQPKQAVKDIRLENEFKWQKQHWESIRSAYSSAPYFLYYGEAFEPFYAKKYDWLKDWNEAMLHCVFNILKLEFNPTYTTAFAEGDSIIDLRNVIHPKQHSAIEFPSYLQVFTAKFPFQPNLSIIDLLFNEGISAKNYLSELPLTP